MPLVAEIIILVCVVLTFVFVALTIRADIQTRRIKAEQRRGYR